MKKKQNTQFLKEHDKMIEKQREQKRKNQQKKINDDRPGHWPFHVKIPNEPEIVAFVQKGPPDPKQFDKEPDKEEIREQKKNSKEMARSIETKASERLQAGKQQKVADQIARIKQKRLERSHGKGLARE